MSVSTGTAVNMNDSRVQALRALVNSVALNGQKEESSDIEKATKVQMLNLSNKLGEVFGEGAAAANDGAGRNAKGELVNAEGLPIIDINEPVSTTEEVTFRPTGTFDDPDVLPLWTLSEQEKTRRKAERERILDILEEEERVEQERDRVASRERLQAELEKRKEAAKTEMENLKRARELQKKMGRALIRNVIETRDRDEQDRTQQALEDKEKEEAKKALKPKKSVSFADVDDESDSETPVQRKGKAVDWGDVSPARLRSQLKSPVLPKTQTQKQPMKMEVVERIPGGQQPHTPTNAHIADSDDESEPDSQSVENDGRQKQEDASNSSATGFEASDGGDPEWDEDDLDYAHHQREIALAYFEKRAAIGAQVSSAINAHTHKVSESEWDQPEVPLDATLASKPPKPLISKFKASRLATGDGAEPDTTLASHSLGGSILPSSQSSAIKRAIHMGKLENGQLVGSGSDESDEDDNIREIVEMLKNGEFTNVGPDSPLVVTKETLPSSTPIIPSTSSIRPVVPKSQSKVSKSAIMRSQGHLQVPVKSLLFSPTSSGPGTPITLTERSSPKVMSPQSATTVPSPPFSSPQADKDAPFTPQYSSHSPSNPNIPNTGMPSMIIDSPSFLNAGESLGMEPQSCQSMIIDSSIPPITPYSTLSPSTLPTPPQHSNPGTYSVTERPSVVMASEVRESTGTNRQSVPSGHGKKISRFLAERM